MPLVVVREDNCIIVPKPPIEAIVYWSKKIDRSDSEFNADKMVLECLKWPVKTDKLCFNCCHPFDNTPIPLPVVFDKKRNIYFCHGNFCSWQCSKAYNINEMPKAGQGNRNMNISLLSRQTWSNYRKDNVKRTVYSLPITPAPRRSELKCFGGDLSIEEYRKNSFGIIPPEEAYECKPFLTIRNRIALPFVDKNTTLKVSENQSTNDNNYSAFNTTHIDSSVVHQHANKFCERLNKAKNDKILIKRERKEDTSKNTLLSSMGVVVKKKR